MGDGDCWSTEAAADILLGGSQVRDETSQDLLR